MAPGVDILSTRNGGIYEKISGTSMAAPLVSSLAVLMKSIDPKLSPSQIESILKSTTNDLFPSSLSETAIGAGMVDACKAVAKVL